MGKTTTPKNQVKEDKAAKRRRWKKPNDKPKRPLSAYNFFFHLEREKIVLESVSDSDKLSPEALANVLKERTRRPHRKSHGKIGFISLARTVAAKWKTLEKEKKAPFEAQAKKEKERYRREIEEWKKAQEVRKKEDAELKRSATPNPEETKSANETPNASNGHSVLDELHQLRTVSGDNTPEITEEAIKLSAIWGKAPTRLGSLYEEYPDMRSANIGPYAALRDDQMMFSGAPGVYSCLEDLASELDDECFDVLSAFRTRPTYDTSALHLHGLHGLHGMFSL